MTITRIAQISDCHLPADHRQKYRGINPHDNLKMLLKKVRAMKPDLVLASGDLSEDGSRISYETLQKYFASLDTPALALPILALPGNHDEVELLAEVFPGSPADTIAISKHGPWYIVRLNSCLPGKPEGRLSEKMLFELEAFLQHSSQFHVLIALHHQPIPMNSPWIDKYRLLEPEAFLALIDQNPNVRVVTWGHVHQVFTAERNGTVMLGNPSSAINGLPGAQKFTADMVGPACRWLELGADGAVKTGLIS